jgi:L-alanine-DL-glutamate epimerase-like enolase superfamily enzyme
MAAWDLRARREGRPLATLLVEQAPRGEAIARTDEGVSVTGPLAAVPVNALLSAEDRAGASAQAAHAVAAGFRCLKLKVGIGDDAGRLAAVRAAVGPDVAIRIDANRAWSGAEALANLRALAPIGIELCEEPTGSADDLAGLREAGVPLAMDESAVGAASFAGADAVCLRLGSHGGISAVLEAARRARADGADVYLSSTFDGPVGVAAAVHAAAALRVTRPCGLATAGLLADVADPLPPRDGAIPVPKTPGLGIADRTRRSG